MSAPKASLGVILDRDSVDRDDLDFGGLCKTLPQWRLYDTCEPAPVAERMAGAAVVVANKVVLDAALLKGAPDLRLVCVAATGTNNVDVAAARTLDIPVWGLASQGAVLAAVALFLFTRPTPPPD